MAMAMNDKMWRSVSLATKSGSSKRNDWDRLSKALREMLATEEACEQVGAHLLRELTLLTAEMKVTRLLDRLGRALED
jgi:hypothetical protein